MNKNKNRNFLQLCPNKNNKFQLIKTTKKLLIEVNYLINEIFVWIYK